MSTKFRTWYMDDAVFNLAEVIETAKKRLANVDFDTLVGTGFSGGLVIPTLALQMGKKFVLIRKETDDSHHGKGRLLGELGDKWILVDDFVSSGKTRRRVIEKINEAVEMWGEEGRPEMVGEYMYKAFDNYDQEVPGRFLPYNPQWSCEPRW